MKIRKFITTLSLLFGVTFMTHAQSSVDEIVKEYLDTMPESGYGFKPAPELRSFAEQMLHFTDATYGFASAATGVNSPIGQGESEKQRTNPRQMSQSS
ncbi:hypothetical protein ACFSQD_11150 [Flavihumibacter stibioxidans]|uniref:hypothetical protein n=1 Tax=Flavihumibacter stibioxidans TaxID=1834163 RepID=UPI001C9DF32F|nr:hypothetical protein [Flavihumibacter stibioxidans]